MKTSAEIALFVIEYNNLSITRERVNKRGGFARDLMKTLWPLRERALCASRRKRGRDVRHIYHCRDIRRHLCQSRVDKSSLKVNNSHRAVKRVFNISTIGFLKKVEFFFLLKKENVRGARNSDTIISSR